MSGGGVDMMVKITYYGEKGTVYTKFEDRDDAETGEWDAPFPNQTGNSMAFGLEESLMQSPMCPPELREEGLRKISAVIVL